MAFDSRVVPLLMIFCLMVMIPASCERFRTQMQNEENAFDYEGFAEGANFCQDVRECGESEVCAAYSSAQRKEFSLTKSAKKVKDGICTADILGGGIKPGANDELPIPLAYYPFLEGKATSWPVPDKTVDLKGVTSTRDNDLGSVVHFSPSSTAFIDLPINANNFSINFWMRVSAKGSIFQHSFKVQENGKDVGDYAWLIYIEENDDKRNVIKATTADGATFIGEYQGGICEADWQSDGPVLINNEMEWNMVTITASQNGYSFFFNQKKILWSADTGFRGSCLPLDLLEMMEPNNYTITSKAQIGGTVTLYRMFEEPMEKIILPFEGDIAFFSIFDSVILEEQVGRLWNAQPELHNDRKNHFYKWRVLIGVGMMLGSIVVGLAILFLFSRRCSKPVPKNEERHPLIQGEIAA